MSGHRGWPPALIELAVLIGDGATLKLVAAYGGTKLYVPLSPDAAGPLARAIGPDAARMLARSRWAGDEINVPLAAALRSKKRAILGERGNNRQVARALGTTTRYVRMVRNRGIFSDPAEPELPFKGRHKGRR